MDLRAYYQKVRETEAHISSPYAVVVSLVTPDGGRAGVVTEVPTPIGARMIVEGAARPATDDETRSFRQQQASNKLIADNAVAASKVHVVVVPAAPTPKIPVHSGKDQ